MILQQALVLQAMVQIIEAISAFGATSEVNEAVAEEEGVGVMIVGTEDVMGTAITETEEMIEGLRHHSVMIEVGIDGVAIHHTEAVVGRHLHREERVRLLMAHGIVEMHHQA